MFESRQQYILIAYFLWIDISNKHDPSHFRAIAGFSWIFLCVYKKKRYTTPRSHCESQTVD